MTDEMRCAECDCGNGGTDCNWIKGETTDQRAMVAAALERAEKIAMDKHDAAIKWASHYLKKYDAETDSLLIAREIRALIDTDHAAALDALVQERAGSMLAEIEMHGYRRGQEDEREACANVGYRTCADTRHVTLGLEVAAAIRARGGQHD